MRFVTQPGRTDQNQPLDAVAVLDGKLRGHAAAEREADQPHPLDAERIEQVEIMHDVIVHLRDRRVVTGFAEARMKRHDDAEFLRPRRGEIDAVPDTGAVQKHQRLAAPGRRARRS